MSLTAYHKNIIDYYQATENAYKDTWDLDNSLAIHYGFWDEKVKTFAQSLQRMNEIMMEAVNIKKSDVVLDAGCGIGGSSIYLAKKVGCKVTGITLSEKQVEKAKDLAGKNNLIGLLDFRSMNYCATDFPDETFDVVWGCESVCYAENKEQFVKEAWRLLKAGGRLVVADGFVKDFSNNDQSTIRNWLDGWQVNYLESPVRFSQFINDAGFSNVKYRDITLNAMHSAKRLNQFYYLANLYLFWKTITFSSSATAMQKKNINACKYQYRGIKRGLWQYGLFTAIKQ